MILCKVCLLPLPSHIHSSQKKNNSPGKSEWRSWDWSSGEVTGIPVPGLSGKGQHLGRCDRLVDLDESLYLADPKDLVNFEGTHCIWQLASCSSEAVVPACFGKNSILSLGGEFWRGSGEPGDVLYTLQKTHVHSHVPQEPVLSYDLWGQRLYLSEDVKFEM